MTWYGTDNGMEMVKWLPTEPAVLSLLLMGLTFTNWQLDRKFVFHFVNSGFNVIIILVVYTVCIY